MPERRYNIPEYLEFERAAEVRHEFQDGEILAMPGGSLNHRLITANVMGETGNALKGRPCRVAGCQPRIRIPSRRYVYADALVLCGPPRFDPDDELRHTITNPRVVIEVLSPSTEANDRGDKFARYREIDSLEEYLLIAEDRAQFESVLRQPDGTWSFQTTTGIDIPMTEIYAGVEWPAADAAGEADPAE